jgi:hypothetical protein
MWVSPIIWLCCGRHCEQRWDYRHSEKIRPCVQKLNALALFSVPLLLVTQTYEVCLSRKPFPSSHPCSEEM